MIRGIRIASFSLVAVSLLAATPAWAQTFPATGDWTPLHRHGAVYSDLASPVDDDSCADAVGDTVNPALFIASDETSFYVRMRVDESALDPDDPTEFNPSFGWSCVADTDSDLTAFEMVVALNGLTGQVELYVSAGTGLALVASYDPLIYAEEVKATSTFSGDADYFVDFAVDNLDLATIGVDGSTPIRFTCGTFDGSSNDAINLDWVGASGQPSSEQDIISDSYLCGDDGCQVCTTSDLCGRDCLPCEGGASCQLLDDVCDDGTSCVIGDVCGSGETCSASWQCAGGTAPIDAGVSPTADASPTHPDAGMVSGDAHRAGDAGAIDAGHGQDATIVEDNGQISGSGLGCSIAGSRGRPASAVGWLLALLGVALVVRRR